MAPLGDAGRSVARPSYAPRRLSLQPVDMEHIRNVYDEDTKDKRYSCIVSPRVDAQMLRNTERHSIPCECIVEIYELLWRWGHRNTSRPSFEENFGFSIPDTIVFVKGRPYAWYFVSKKDGALLRKSDANLSLALVEKKLCRDRLEGETPICATWLPMASQFQESRCHSPNADFLTINGCRNFLACLHAGHSGVLQAFVDPHGVSNFLVRTVQYKHQTSLCVRTNRSVLSTAVKGNTFDRCATFEGWPGLSSTSSRYRTHKHPHMEEMILAAGDALNGRVEEERVRQMLFLGPTQHVALHFKTTSDHELFFIYASVVSEKDVILQSRPQLLMGDPCMTDVLPGSALLPGGTEMKAIPYRGPVPGSPRDPPFHTLADVPMDEADRDYQRLLQRGGFAPDGSTGMSSRGRNDTPEDDTSRLRRRVRSVPKMAKDGGLNEFIPRMPYSRPYVPEPPYRIQDPPREEDHLGRPTANLDSLKKPLIFPVSARAILSPMSARASATTSRSEPGGYSGGSGRPPRTPDLGGSGPI